LKIRNRSVARLQIFIYLYILLILKFTIFVDCFPRIN